MELIEYNGNKIWSIRIYSDPFKDIKSNGKEKDTKISFQEIF